jgi:hypothetical protein
MVNTARRKDDSAKDHASGSEILARDNLNNEKAIFQENKSCSAKKCGTTSIVSVLTHRSSPGIEPTSGQGTCSLACASKRPLVLIFAGPSGHRKTELARGLGDHLSLKIELVNYVSLFSLPPSD